MSINFAEVKARVSITQVVTILGLVTKEQANGQLRAKCPVAGSEDDRAIVITPSLGLFKCFACDKGGDQISLYAHIKACSMKEAAEAIGEPASAPAPAPKKGFDAQKYLAALQHVEGLPVQLCEQVGIGRAVKGAHAGKVVVALRDSSGAIIVFASVTDLKLPAKW